MNITFPAAFVLAPVSPGSRGLPVADAEVTDFGAEVEEATEAEPGIGAGAEEQGDVQGEQPERRDSPAAGGAALNFALLVQTSLAWASAHAADELAEKGRMTAPEPAEPRLSTFTLPEQALAAAGSPARSDAPRRDDEHGATRLDTTAAAEATEAEGESAMGLGRAAGSEVERSTGAQASPTLPPVDAPTEGVAPEPGLPANGPDGRVHEKSLERGASEGRDKSPFRQEAGTRAAEGEQKKEPVNRPLKTTAAAEAASGGATSIERASSGAEPSSGGPALRGRDAPEKTSLHHETKIPETGTTAGPGSLLGRRPAEPFGNQRQAAQERVAVSVGVPLESGTTEPRLLASTPVTPFAPGSDADSLRAVGFQLVGAGGRTELKELGPAQQRAADTGPRDPQSVAAAAMPKELGAPVAAASQAAMPSLDRAPVTRIREKEGRDAEQRPDPSTGSLPARQERAPEAANGATALSFQVSAEGSTEASAAVVSEKGQGNDGDGVQGPPHGSPPSHDTRPATTHAGAVSEPRHRSTPQADSLSVQLRPALAELADRPVEIRLDPAELGRVTLTLTLDDTRPQITIVAERSETLELFRRSAESLAAEFRALGYGGVGLSFGMNDRRSGQTPKSFRDRDLPPRDESVAGPPPEIISRQASHPRLMLGAAVDLRS